MMEKIECNVTEPRLRDGAWFIDELSSRLKFEKKLSYDSAILQLLSRMDRFELLQLVTSGRVSKWQNEIINQLEKN